MNSDKRDVERMISSYSAFLQKWREQCQDRHHLPSTKQHSLCNHFLKSMSILSENIGAAVFNNGESSPPAEQRAIFFAYHSLITCDRARIPYAPIDLKLNCSILRADLERAVDQLATKESEKNDKAQSR